MRAMQHVEGQLTGFVFVRALPQLWQSQMPQLLPQYLPLFFFTYCKRKRRVYVVGFKERFAQGKITIHSIAILSIFIDHHQFRFTFTGWEYEHQQLKSLYNSQDAEYLTVKCTRLLPSLLLLFYTVCRRSSPYPKNPFQSAGRMAGCVLLCISSVCMPTMSRMRLSVTLTKRMQQLNLLWGACGTVGGDMAV